MTTFNRTILESVAIASTLCLHHVQAKPDGGASYQPGFKGFKDAMALNGMDYLGSGYFSAAFYDTATGKAIKVGFKREDSGAAYAAFCRMHQGRMGIPNVYDIQRHENCYTVVMDLCTEIMNEHSDYINRGIKQQYHAVSAAVYGRDHVIPSDAPNVKRLEALMETGRLIHEFFKGIAEFDCHSGNVMVAPDGNVVVTDPISFTQGIAGWDVLDSEEALSNERDRIHREKCKSRHEFQLNKAARRKQQRKEKEQRQRERDARIAAEPKRRIESRQLNRLCWWGAQAGVLENLDLPFNSLRRIAQERLVQQHIKIARNEQLDIDRMLQNKFLMG